MTPAPLLLIAAAGGATGILIGRSSSRGWLAVTVVATAAALAAAVLVLAGAPEWEWRSEFALAGEPLHLRLDALSAFFLALLAVIGGAGAIYSRGYWSDRTYPQSAPRGRMWWSALLVSMAVVVLSSNGLHFLIAWELFAVGSYFLITLQRHELAVRAAGWLYFAASHAGTLCLFAFFAALAAHHNGSWDLASMRHDTALAPCFWLVLFGFGVKAGLFPVHIWLPPAHANAPSHVSALLSAVSIKMGVYGFLRFSGWLPIPAGAGWVVLGLGAAGALLGIAFALTQNDLKRLLAYSSVENIGIIMIAAGAALIGVQGAAGGPPPAWAQLAFAGALLHVWNHGLFKGLLFFSAGSVLHATGTREMSRLGGLWRAMPWTAALFSIGALAVCALPPLNGFVSEWLIYLGLFDAVNHHGAAAWAAMPAAIILGVTGALALATFVKAASVVFLGASRTDAALHAHEAGGWMRGPMLALALGCFILAFAPLLFWPAIARAAGAWEPAWTDLPAPATLATLRLAYSALIAVVLLAIGVIWRQSHRRPIQRRGTWDCGYAAPGARMQYTSGSFGGLAGGWFTWVLQPERKILRPRGFFPREARRIERVPDTVLERILLPISGTILAVSTAVRRLQHGRLQYYIVYVLSGVAALGAIVWVGGKR